MKHFCIPKKNMYFALAACLSLAIQTNSAHAGSYITPGTPAAQGGAQSNLDGAQIIVVPVESNRSYACSLVGIDSNTSLKIIPSATETDFFRKCGHITPKVSGNSVSDTDLTDNRFCMIASATGDTLFTIDSEKSGGEPARMECLETTLYGGYNTNANPYNFLEITNISNTEIKGYITATDFNGTVTINMAPFIVGANNRVDVDIHTAAGANRFGSIRVTHNGPYGAVQAAVSQYTGPVDNLSLSTSIPLKPREQNL